MKHELKRHSRKVKKLPSAVKFDSDGSGIWSLHDLKNQFRNNFEEAENK